MIKDINHRFTADIQNIDKRQPTRTRIIDRIIKRQQIRTREDVGEWRTALNIAEDVLHPDRSPLIKIYKDVDLDGHITGIINTIKNKIKAKPFNIVNSNGDIDEAKTELFQKEWYFNFVDFVVEAPFWGYSLIQLGDIKDDGFPDIELVPREYVLPDFELVKKELLTSGRQDEQNSFFYNEAPLNDWFIFIGGKKTLGLYNKATPHALSKKNLFTEMWEYAELFGMPIRKGHTDIHDPDRKKNMDMMLENMGSAAWGTFDNDDNIDLTETAKDNAQVFIEPIKLSNEEISKAFAGQVATFDEKAFVGSAEVQEGIFNEFVLSFMRSTGFAVNNELMPRMQRHRIIPEGFRHKWKEMETVSIIDKSKIITDLTKVGYTFTPETVTDEVGIEVEGVKEPAESTKPPPPENKLSTVMNEVKALYKDFV